MNFKKRVNGSWTNTPHYIHNTSTDTITTLPAVVYPNAATATIGLKGQTVQNGTPTPTNPIQPQSCGDLETTGEHAGRYKIPISSANTTTPVYPGEVETTRKIKKLVLDGTENWVISSAWKKTNTSVFYFSVSGIGGASDNERYILSTHFASKSRTELYRDDVEGIGKSGGNAVTVRVDDTIATTVNDFKAWLRDNNVTIWYVLATPETAVVNEPLMRIGNYADEVSNISIPVTAGGDTLSVGTTVQPSEVTVNYKGWHPVSEVHERENGAWT